MNSSTVSTTIETLRAKQAELKTRLDTGMARIEEAQKEGQDVSDWEEYWAGLLRQYELVSDKLKLLKETEGEEEGQE